MASYDFKTQDNKWQNRWEEARLNECADSDKRPKFYCLVEFPYPSGDGLHVGHIRPYTAMDIVARKKRMDGYNVIFPIGLDAFGLPAENYAIKTGIHPKEVTAQNIKRFTKQLKSIGFSFDWSRCVVTADPSYYKWTQWIFLKIFENGLAYKAKIPINWCLSCKIGLANEEVAGGVCERCGSKVEKREKEQWMFKITKYADRLIEDLSLVDYLDRIKTQQINWIGRKEWIDITYPIDGASESIVVSTTRPDTNWGSTFIVLAPEHPILSIKKGIVPKEHRAEVDTYIEAAKKKSDLERVSEERKKTGVFTGLYCINQLSGKKMPIWVTDFVLMDVGTGAVVGVPGHDMRDFEFAQEFGLPIVRVVVGKDGDTSPITRREQVQEEDGVMINSGFLDGIEIHKAIDAIMDHIEKQGWGKRTIRYHLRDWVFSRQRYWGEPIPLVHCKKCGWVPIPESELPLELPPIGKYEPTDSGESPLAALEDWVNTTCPKCGGIGKRETDTMPNWAGSNWYFLRYCDPKNDKELANAKKLKYWMPVDWYNGGMEHATLHLLYSRFIYKFLWDIGVVPKACGPEPYKKRTAHGMVLGEGDEKMSKSRGNVVVPDTVINEFGADTLRVYEMFLGPFDQTAVWDSHGILGVKRFLDKVWGLLDMKIKRTGKDAKKLLHQTIKKVGEDIEAMRFNTAVSAMMILVNEMQSKGFDKETLEKLLVILAPFAPHLAESCWEKLGNKEMLFADAKWPEYDESLICGDEIELIVQVNGKHRATIKVPTDTDKSGAIKVARENENVAKHMEDKEIIKEIFVPGRLVNFVVK